MNTPYIRYDFESGDVPDAFTWLNPPAACRVENGLHITTAPDTDFWQRTHYGFRRDTGHALLTPVTGDFSLETAVTFSPAAQYDQCGLFLRVDAENWIKASTEYETPEHSRLGSVVTNLGYSDWATQDLVGAVNSMAYRIQRCGDDFLIEAKQAGRAWQQLRIAHLHRAPDTLAMGLYACSPKGSGFSCTFQYLNIAESRWH